MPVPWMRNGISVSLFGFWEFPRRKLTSQNRIGTWATKEQLATWHLARLRLHAVSWIPDFKGIYAYIYIYHIWANHCLLDESFFSWFPWRSQFLMTWININKHTKNYHLHESTSKTSFTACQATFGQVDIMGAPAVAHLITNLTSKSGRFWWNMLSLWSRSKHQILAHPVGFPNL